ncbi:hypothetical protein [Sphingomonas sp. BK235]|uniref:hypothetical protein n=1 Tax=Sphingomonas sp. BK235 TaxID=2512131 RepID=UPI00104337D1|nr:hypothetical protein [Sphingomonas sp. BK235]TCP30695.1 hypothetical protein EV292_11252 [Sphingomonas sp. BK235]
MSRRLEVLRAVIALVATALPAAEVVGLDEREDLPTRVRAGGRAIVRAGDPGEPSIDLSPLTYNWTHRIPLEILMSDEDTLDAALEALDGAIDSDRQLGGLCEWLEAEAPATQNVRAENAAGVRGAGLSLVAIYATSSPLT